MKTRLVGVVCVLMLLALAGVVRGGEPPTTAQPPPVAAEGALIAAPEAGALAGEGIALLVLNRQGQPAAGARVEAYAPGVTSVGWKGLTDSAGRADVAVADGPWNLVVSSSADHLVLVREGVIAPTSLSLDSLGATPIDLCARGLGGQPLTPAEYSVERYAGGTNRVGRGDARGCLRAYVSPGAYDAAVVSADDRTYLRRPVTVGAAPLSVAFDAAPMDTGQVTARHGDASPWALMAYTNPRTRAWTLALTLADGQSATLSLGRYDLYLRYEALDAGEVRWVYYYLAGNAPQDVSAGAALVLWMGGDHSVTIAPRSPVYRPGATVWLTPQILDEHGNRLRQIGRGPQQTAVLGRLLVRDGQGDVVYEADTSFSGSVSFALPREASQGIYQVTWEVDSGPLAGLLSTRTAFLVQGEPLPPSPTPVASPTPISTATPTPTPTPTATPVGPWLSWRDGGGRLLLPRAGRTVEARYGNIPLPATLTIRLTGAAVLAGGGQTQYVAASALGKQSLAIVRGPGAVVGDPFTLRVSLGGQEIERSGVVARDLLWPLWMRP